MSVSCPDICGIVSSELCAPCDANHECHGEDWEEFDHEALENCLLNYFSSVAINEPQAVQRSYDARIGGEPWPERPSTLTRSATDHNTID